MSRPIRLVINALGLAIVAVALWPLSESIHRNGALLFMLCTISAVATYWLYGWFLFRRNHIVTGWRSSEAFALLDGVAGFGRLWVVSTLAQVVLGIVVFAVNGHAALLPHWWVIRRLLPIPLGHGTYLAAVCWLAAWMCRCIRSRRLVRLH